MHFTHLSQTTFDAIVATSDPIAFDPWNKIFKFWHSNMGAFERSYAKI
jgi:hypothetical protein